MSYYAGCNGWIRLPANEEAIRTVYEALGAKWTDTSGWSDLAAEFFGEHTVYLLHPDDPQYPDGVQLDFSTSEKISEVQDQFLKAIAPYATGVLNWIGEDNTIWRDRLINGEHHSIAGRIVYDDPFDAS